MTLRRFAFAASALCLLALSGCDDTDAASVRIKLKPDGGGSIALSNIINPTTPTAPENVTSGSGLTWDGRAGVAVARGNFSDISSLNVGEITFKRTVTGNQNYLEVVMPRGAGVAWPKLLAGATPADRAMAAKMMLPDEPETKLGTLVKVVIELPAKPLTTAANVSGKGVSASADDKVVTLIVPLTTAMDAGKPLVWVTTWE